MDIEKLQQHVKLCKKNLKSKRVKCCANCPFEDEIVSVYPDLKKMFNSKKRLVGMKQKNMVECDACGYLMTPEQYEDFPECPNCCGHYVTEHKVWV